MGIFSKIKSSLQTAHVLTGVGKVIVTGKGAKVLDKIENGAQIADKAIEVYEMLKALKKKK